MVRLPLNHSLSHHATLLLCIALHDETKNSCTGDYIMVGITANITFSAQAMFNTCVFWTVHLKN